MTHPTRRAALLRTCGLLALSAPTLAAEPGQPAPALQLPGTAGAVDLAALKGRVIYLDFWASWCVPCRLSFPWMNDMQARYGARGLQVLAVNLDAKRPAAEAFLAQVPARFAVAFDSAGDTPKRYGVKAMPTSVLVGADGTVLQQHAGFRDDDRAALEASIVAALAKAGR